MKKCTNILLLNLIPLFGMAQATVSNDFFGNIGKIYVVVGVIMILFLSIVAFLVYLDRKVTRLEQEFED